MCRVHQASKGANLVSNPSTPEVAETPHETYTNIVSQKTNKSFMQLTLFYCKMIEKG